MTDLNTVTPTPVRRAARAATRHQARGRRRPGKIKAALKVASPFDLALGQRIRQGRTLRGLSQSGLAAGAGCTFQQVQKYERGFNRVSAGRLVAIARTLDCPIASLLGEDNALPLDRDLLHRQRLVMELAKAASGIADRVIIERMTTLARAIAEHQVVRPEAAGR